MLAFQHSGRLRMRGMQYVIVRTIARYTGGNMKIVLLAMVLLLGACDGPSAPAPKIAEPQREALEKAKSVDQTLQQSNEEMQKIGDAEEK